MKHRYITDNIKLGGIIAVLALLAYLLFGCNESVDKKIQSALVKHLETEKSIKTTKIENLTYRLVDRRYLYKTTDSMLDVVYPLIMDELKQRFEKTKQLQGLTAQYLLEFGKNASLTREQQEQYNESQSKLEKQRENVTRHSVIKDQLAKELASLSVKSLETKYYFIDKASVFKEVKGITDTIHIEGYLIDEDFKVVPFSSVFKSHWIKDMYGNKEN